MLGKVELYSTNINRGFNFFLSHGLDNQFRNIPGDHRFRHLIVLDAVGHHGQTERTAHGNRVGLHGDSLLGARIVDSLSDIFFHPHSRATGAAAEALVEIAFHFHKLNAGNGFQNLTGLIVNIVVTAEEAGIVIDKCARAATGLV